jgi:hypothetical protein
MKSPKPKLTFKIEPDGGTATVIGRDAWCLSELLGAGSHGVTPLERPAPRWSHYVYKLRKAGLVIETIDESHSGPFAGTHGRYVLRTKVSIVPPLDGSAA